MRDINIKKREQVDKTLEVSRGDEGELSAVGRAVYEDWEEGWTRRCPTLGSPFDDDARLRLKKISSRRIPGGLVEVSLYYELPRETSFEFGGAEETEYSMDYSCSEQPLLTHPKFKGLSEEEQDALMAVEGGAYTKDSFVKDEKVI